MLIYVSLPLFIFVEPRLYCRFKHMVATQLGILIKYMCKPNRLILEGFVRTISKLTSQNNCEKLQQCFADHMFTLARGPDS